MWFCRVLHGKFHDRGYSDVLYGINSINTMGCCTPNTYSTQSHGNYLALLPWLSGFEYLVKTEYKMNLQSEYKTNLQSQYKLNLQSEYKMNLKSEYKMNLNKTWLCPLQGHELS